MENKINIWSLNFGFLLSILLHVYVIFFLTEFNLNLFDKKERIVITLSAIGTMDESPKESIKKEKRRIRMTRLLKIRIIEKLSL